MKQFNSYSEKAVVKLKQAYSLGEREKVIDVVYKHPIQLALIFTVTILAYLLILVTVYFLTSAISNGDNVAIYRTTSFAAFSMAIFVGLILVIATYLFLQTKIIITSESLILIVQRDLLHSKVSRLALTDIEDVIAEQQGLLATLFGYSNLVIETAGAQVNFSFNYCPRPGYVAKETVDAKEDLISGSEIYTS
jgi:uncharacterized membrane protein YdbT with pleckstrin-like domain